MPSYTEFYCDPSAGDNMNGGSDSGSPSYTATNGGWNSGTGVFTPTSGDPSLSVTVGQFAAVFTDGSTTPAFVGRVTARNSTTVTVSVTVKTGTVPTTAGSGISIRVGGAWKGPNGSVGWPFTATGLSACVNSSSHQVRVNLKNNATYNITATIASNFGSRVTWQGYSSTIADGGRITIDGGTSGASYSLLTVSNGLNMVFQDIIFQNNGATGSASAVNCGNTNSTAIFRRCVVHDVCGNGFFNTSNQGSWMDECEAYACNQSNSFNLAGFNGAALYCTRCISHDNTGSNTSGFYNCGTAFCIADSNGRVGFYFGSHTNSDAYNNGSHGWQTGIGGSGMTRLLNCNFINNGGYGVNNATGQDTLLIIANCGFRGNTSGARNLPATSTGSAVIEYGTVDYTDAPYVDAANGDFRISLAEAKNAGAGTFLQTAASYSGTVGYPDIGAAQHQDSGAGGLLTNPGLRGGFL